MGNGDPEWMTAKRGVEPSHTFAANVQSVIDKYEFNEDSGYFGVKGSRSNVRRLTSDDPVSAAHDFFARLTVGGKLENLSNGKGWRVDLKDGSTIVLRDKSSDGSPSMQIEISREYEGRVKSQKIHFIPKEDGK